ncbi:MAG: hypothetical protein AB7P14_10300 [Blastocatellales bacterium]
MKLLFHYILRLSGDGRLRRFHPAIVRIALIGCSAFFVSPFAQPSRMTVAAEGEGNNVTIRDDGKTVMLDVSSRKGIGQATIKNISMTSPERVVVRLNLKALEEFRLSYDRIAVIAHVSNDDGDITQSFRLPDGDEHTITPDSPHWLKIRIVSDETSPRLPLDEGHFEITLPKDVIGKADRAFSIRWVDFHR